MNKLKKPALGRGLSALLQSAETDVTVKPTKENDKMVDSISKIPVENIEANPFQPRTHFEEEALEELTESIKLYGIIQPVTVRKLGYDKYQLISGERRFRASQLAGMKEIPAYIRIANDQAMLEMALVENIQRSDLDAIEIAISFKRLLDECKITQEELSEKVSKNRSTVTNYLRLLKLPPEIQLGIRKHLISMGHARALLALDNLQDQLHVFESIITDNLSVREVEKICKELSEEKNNKKSPSKKQVKETEGSTKHYYVADQLSSKFNTKVLVKTNPKGQGVITIHFKSEQDFIKISEKLGIK